MEFNIAFNSIFYISIFILPGLLLRRFYFSGEFNKEFSQGHLLERFIWTVFSSVFCLLLCAIIFLFIRYASGKQLLSAISYNTIKEVFDLLGSNSLPSEKRFNEVYVQFLILLFGVYLFSILFGYIFNRLVLSTRADSFLPVLKFRNYWYYFVRGRKESDLTFRNKKYLYTDADILVKVTDSKTKLYSGIIADYYINPGTNQLENIFLMEARRYKFDQNKNFEIKEIPGNFLCLSYDNIININLTYIYRDKENSQIATFVWWITRLLYYAFIGVIISYLWIDKVPLFNFDSFPLKIFFGLNSWIIASLIKSIIKLLIFKSKNSSFAHLIISTLFFLSQYLWIYGDRTFFHVFIPSVITFLALIGLFVKTEDKGNTEVEGEVNNR